MSNDISPEEKLFNIIKADKSKPRPAAVEVVPAFAFPSWLERFDFKQADKIFLAVLAVLVVLIGVVVFRSPEISIKQIAAMPLDNVPVLNTSPVPAYQPVDVYLAQVKKRDLFHPVLAADGSLVPLGKLTNKDFVLSGIFLGQYPQALIKVVSQDKVYFLKEGDNIEGYKVKSIQKDKVILQQGDEQIELL
ncbi:MAG: hypothetical protein HQL22_11935 [Candidatus Omnitrophica bacterium]|nr:hypothetical protein [Candidatus Omnitrophota bacterium]